MLFYNGVRAHGQGMLMKERSPGQDRAMARPRRGDSGLGPNSDIGARLRDFYGRIQEEAIPDRFLDLLEKLDQVEQKSSQNDRGPK